MSTQASAQNTMVSGQEFPVLLRVEGDRQQAIPLIHFPFTIGRRAEKHMVITDPMASRDHAEIVQMGGQYYLLDLGSKQATLLITGAERGFVFLVGKEGDLSLAVGRNSLGDELKDDTTISHSILKDAMTSASRVIITDTASHSDLAARQSIVAHDLRTVICMPLFRSNIAALSQQPEPNREHPVINGVLYLDSRLASRGLSSLSRDILNTVATEA